jgi:hypothetical protein
MGLNETTHIACTIKLYDIVKEVSNAFVKYVHGVTDCIIYSLTYEACVNC